MTACVRTRGGVARLAHRALSCAVSRMLSAVVAITLACVPCARADLPGSIPLSASGDGHLWWIVRNAPETGRPQPARASAPQPTESYALMHHASDEPAPTERLVLRFAREPIALAAEGARVVVLTRTDEGDAPFILTLFAAKNEAVGHWYTLPRTAPILLKALPVAGEVRAVALAGDRLGVLMRLRREDAGQPRGYWFGTLACESGADSVWREEALPPVDPVEATSLFAVDGRFAVLGSREGRSWFATLSDERAWEARELTHSAGDAGRLAPRAVLGGFAIGSIPVVVDRIRPSDGVDKSHARIRAGLVRDGVVRPWAEFDEPDRAWSLGSFGSRGVLLELGEKGRGVARDLSLSASEPEPVVPLKPPGFASGSWVHLPIVGVLSVALVLCAVIFGSDAYLDARLRAAGVGAAPGASTRSRRTARGAPLGRRGTGMLIDLLPGLLVVWFFVGGSPLDLLQFPISQTSLEQALPSLVVLGIGWAFATIGDVVFGRSLGKRVMGLVIVSAKGGALSRARLLARSLASLVTVANPIVMLLAWLHPRGDGPAEMLSGTAVVDQGAATVDAACSLLAMTDQEAAEALGSDDPSEESEGDGAGGVRGERESRGKGSDSSAASGERPRGPDDGKRDPRV